MMKRIVAVAALLLAGCGSTTASPTTGVNGEITVFAAASLALLAACALGVIVGSALSNYVGTRHLSILAGVGFVAIGLWTLWGGLRG